jgi:hypothetical protein
MPKYGEDAQGKYVAFGTSKYHYKSEAGRKRALAKVKRQEKAARANGWRGKG